MSSAFLAPIARQRFCSSWISSALLSIRFPGNCFVNYNRNFNFEIPSDCQSCGQPTVSCYRAGKYIKWINQHTPDYKHSTQRSTTVHWISVISTVPRIWYAMTKSFPGVGLEPLPLVATYQKTLYWALTFHNWAIIVCSAILHGGT